MKKNLYLLLVIFLAACSGTSQVVKKEKAASPNFDDMIARESKGLGFNKTDGPLSLSLFSASPAITRLTSESQPQQYEVNIPIGASINADCYITEESTFPSVVLKNIFDSIGTLPTVKQHRVKEIKAGVMHNLPYLYIETEYITKDKLYGVAKMIASSSVDVSFYCSHDELGYKETFLEAVTSLSKSQYIQSFVEDLSQYRKKQIDIMYLNDMSVGYAEHYQMELGGNDKRDMTFSSTIMPRSVDALFTNDSIDYTTYNGKTGHLLGGEYYSYTNNEPDHELVLKKGLKEDYLIEGVFQGKEVKESFIPQNELIYSGYIVDLYIDNKTDKKLWKFEEYVPLSPVAPTMSTIELLSKKGGGDKTIEYSFAGAKASVELDEKSYSEMTMSFGNASFKMVREYLDIR